MRLFWSCFGLLALAACTFDPSGAARDAGPDSGAVDSGSRDASRTNDGGPPASSDGGGLDRALDAAPPESDAASDSGPLGADVGGSLDGHAPDAEADAGPNPPVDSGVDSGAPDSGLIDDTGVSSDSGPSGGDGGFPTTFLYTPLNFVPSSIQAPTASFIVSGNCTFNSDMQPGYMGSCGGSPPQPQSVTLAGGTTAWVLSTSAFSVLPAGALHFTGSHPVIVVVFGDATVGGVVEANAARETPGPGAQDAQSCAAGTGRLGFGSGAGGGGGGYGTDGAGGGSGNGANGAGPGTANGSSNLEPLAGGCVGGAGSLGSLGGGGGGAFQISAAGLLWVQGAAQISAAGGGGRGGPSRVGGGGGGSGGAIILEGGHVQIDPGAMLLTNGGAGGGGGAGNNGAGSTGQDGENGHGADITPAGGGMPASGGGVGGNGAVVSGNGATGASGSGMAGGGGGGGGTGRYRIHGGLPGGCTTVVGATLSGNGIMSCN